MEELVGYLLLIGVGVAAAGFALWVVVAALARVFSYVLVYWALTFVAGVLAGVVAGAALPLRVLLGRSVAPAVHLTPDDVVAGTVLPKPPGGPNTAHGWDRAWPTYLPYQAREDALSVGREVARHLGVARDRCFGVRGSAAPDASKGNRRRGRLGKIVRGAFTWSPLLGYRLGTLASTAVWFVVMGVLGVLVLVVRAVGLGVHRVVEAGARRSRRVSARCPRCYTETRLPGFRCPGEGCDITHWTLRPGPLGLLGRRCACGTLLPSTVARAARSLTPACPTCRADLVEGSGARQTVQLALVGGIAAGKSRLLDALLVGGAAALGARDGSVEPLSDGATLYLTRARRRVARRAATAKTQHEQPVGLPFLLERGTSRMELQVIDAAGEAFASWDETSRLRYLDGAAALILALDPLALPQVQDHLRRSRLAQSVLLAQGDQEEAYAAAVDRMRAESVPVARRGLAVVLTKGDVLTQLPVAASLDAADGDGVRRWLVDHGADLMVRRFEKDFRDVSYFVVDSMGARPLGDPLDPCRVLAWLLTRSRAPRRLAEALTPDPVAASAPATA